MKIIPWQVLLIVGLTLLIVKLLIDLLVPIGFALIILGILLYAQDRARTPKVVKK